MSVFKQWNMACPECMHDEALDIEARVSVRLTADGTDTDKSCDASHGWNGESICSCRNCGWDGSVKDAEGADRHVPWTLLRNIIGLVRDEDGDITIPSEDIGLGVSVETIQDVLRQIDG